MVTKHTDVCKVAFASESCLPVVPLPATLALLTSDDHSWLNYSNESDNGYSFQKQVVWLVFVCRLSAPFVML